LTQLEFNSLEYLRLLQLADSAVPIGTAAHSFGLEMLVAAEILTVPQLENFLHDFLVESGGLESGFCRAAHQLLDDKSAEIEQEWLNLNQRLSAFKPGRESREASATLGKRFLQLATGLSEASLLQQAIQTARYTNTDIHLCTAFGLVGRVLGVSADATVLAYLHQTLAGLISACQRLLPLGQSQASRMLWNLKPGLVEIARQSCNQNINTLSCFTPLVDWASMSHPTLTTRLFIS
jgi:urease accessory protein